MRRRDFIALGSITLAAGSLGARAQTKPLIGWLGGTTPEAAATNVNAFLNGLRKHGYEEGKNIDIAYRWTNGDLSRQEALARELLGINPKIIIAPTITGVRVLEKLTTTTPILDPLLVDPIKLGLADSYNHPARNLSGVLYIVDTLPAKQVELLLQVAPKIKNIGVFINAEGTFNSILLPGIEAAAREKGITVVRIEARTLADLAAALAKPQQYRIDSLLVPHDPLFMAGMTQIISFAKAERLPAIYSFRHDVEQGGMMSYSVDIPENFRRAAFFVDRILKGQAPADLPIEFPTKLELVINLKTVKALGLEVPSKLLFTADAVIE